LAFEIPVLDDRLESTSMRAFLDTPLWTRTNAEHSWAAYLGGLHGDVPAFAAPARAHDLSGLPPTLIQACEFDPMRDEAITFALRLLEAEVPTELHVYPGTFHGSSGVVPQAAISVSMKQHRNAAIARALRVAG
ncbi:MAG: alpha/beta hydrolase fold domain-containing protein, partial [bacterium]|nr:alpha/beta hydrolase fold domain-containing protein [bacterium]